MLKVQARLFSVQSCSIHVGRRTPPIFPPFSIIFHRSLEPWELAIYPLRGQRISYWCVLRREFLGMIHFITSKKHPSNPQQPIHFLRAAPVRFSRPLLLTLVGCLVTGSISATLVMWMGHLRCQGAPGALPSSMEQRTTGSCLKKNSI